MVMTVLAAIAVTTLLVTLLCLRDPKRRRAYGLESRSLAGAVRAGLVAGALLPGAAFALAGNAAAFFLWFGGSAVAGWCVALVFARRQRHS